MGIVQKRADELKVGDVLVHSKNFGKRVVWEVIEPTTTDDRVVVRAIATIRGLSESYYIEQGTHVEIESPDLTLAQQNADELARLVRVAADTLRDFEMTSGSAFKAAGMAFAEASRGVLDKIKPPAPPTLEEALALVAELVEGHSTGKAKKGRDLLDRAERAGVAK